MVVTATVPEEELTVTHIKYPKQQYILPHADTTTGRVVLILHPQWSRVNFGVEVYGIDLNDVTNADFDYISDALHKHKLLIFKE
jgi:alpha-ketoglutarate-dependent taurine dioxygenase